MLSDGDEYVRASAAFALGQIGPDAKAAVPHLIEALKYKYVYYHPGYVRTGYLPETVLALLHANVWREMEEPLKQMLAVAVERVLNRQDPGRLTEIESTAVSDGILET